MRHTNKSSLYIIGSLIITTLISGLILFSTLVSADDDTSVVDEINITVPISCTLSGTGMNTHNANINNGQYNSAIGETTMKAFCNDNNGFAIYAIGFTDNEDGKNVLTNSTLGSTYDIETGTAITGNDSQWAMKLSTITSPTPTYPIIIAGSTDDTEKEQGDPDYSTFQEVPDNYALVAKRTASTDIGTNAEGTTLKSTYQAYISKTQPAGTYTGQVKYTLVHPYTAEKPTTPISIENLTYMQDLARLSTDQITSLKSSMIEDTQYQMTDSRDNKIYYVAKLKDGNIWMTQNLDLDLESTPTNVTPLTSENTDLPTNTSWTPSASTHITSDTTWSNSNTTPESYDPGTVYYIEQNNSHYMVGNYYNWTAAIASNNSSNYGQNSLVNQSICPAGWTLPRVGTGQDSFYALLNAYNVSDYPYYGDDKDVWGEPLFYTSGGIWDNDGLYQSYITNLHSAISSSNEYTYILQIGDEWINSIDGFYSRYEGMNIRCIARPITNTIEGL